MSKDKYPRIFSPQMEAIVFIILQILFATRAVLKIGGYIKNCLHLARKYARIFVRGHYLFREANSFPRAQLEEQIMSKDKYPSIFSPQMEAIVFLSFKSFSQRAQF